jgi:cell division protein FtsB
MKRPVKWPRLNRFLVAAVALAIAALALDGIFGSQGLIVTYRLKLQVRQAQQNLQRLNQENQDLAKQDRQLKSDPSAIERVAREQMGLVKPGELVFKAPAKSSSGPNEAAGTHGTTSGAGAVSPPAPAPALPPH